MSFAQSIYRESLRDPEYCLANKIQNCIITELHAYFNGVPSQTLTGIETGIFMLIAQLIKPALPLYKMSIRYEKICKALLMHVIAQQLICALNFCSELNS
jgi:hypothetical protein